MANMQLAIKMGSSSTLIFKQGEGIVLAEPSMVAVQTNGKNRTLRAVGTRAKRILGRTDKVTEVISPIFRGTIMDAELAEAMLKVFLSKIIPKSIRKPAIRAIVCVPIGISSSEAKAFEKVCLNSGIGEVILVPSALCGAVGMSLPVLSASSSFVVNMGGGTTDLAVISSGNIISGVSLGFGGIDLDTAIENFVATELKLLLGEDSSEKIKTEVASLYKNDTSNTEIFGVDTVTSQSRTDVISSADILNIVEEHYHKIALAMRDIMNTCSPEIVADIANEGAFVCGGASGVAGIEQFISDKLNIPVKVDEQADFIEVVGAGKLLSDARTLKELLYYL